jgi:hypothetical protein
VEEDDFLTIKVKDGSGFKTSIGDQVRLAASLKGYLILGIQSRWTILFPD